MSDQTRDTFGNTDEIYFRSFLMVFISFPCLIFTKSLPPTWIKIKAVDGLYNILNCNVDSNLFQCMPDFPIQCTWWLVSPNFFLTSWKKLYPLHAISGNPLQSRHLEVKIETGYQAKIQRRIYCSTTPDDHLPSFLIVPLETPLEANMVALPMRNEWDV